MAGEVKHTQQVYDTKLVGGLSTEDVEKILAELKPLRINLYYLNEKVIDDMVEEWKLHIINTLMKQANLIGREIEISFE